MEMMAGAVAVAVKVIMTVKEPITRMAGVAQVKDGVVVKAVVVTINHVEVELDEEVIVALVMVVVGEASLTPPPHGVVPPAATVVAEDHVSDEEAEAEVEAPPHAGAATMRSTTITKVDEAVVDGVVIAVVVIVVLLVVVVEIVPHVGLAEAVVGEEAIMKVDSALAEDSPSPPGTKAGVVVEVSMTDLALVGTVRKAWARMPGLPPHQALPHRSVASTHSRLPRWRCKLTGCVS